MYCCGMSLKLNLKYLYFKTKVAKQFLWRGKKPTFFIETQKLFQEIFLKNDLRSIANTRIIIFMAQ